MSAGTTKRNFRVPTDEWEAAQAIAKARGESLSDVLRETLRWYTERHTRGFVPDSSEDGTADTQRKP